MLSDDDFVDALRLTEGVSLDGWELFINFKENKVYRQQKPSNPKLYEYMAFGKVKSTAETLAMVYTSTAFRKSWDDYCIEFANLQDDIYYYLVKYPWPLSNREYVYQAQQRTMKDGSIVFLGSSFPDHASLQPEKKGVVRIVDYQQRLVLRDGPDGLCDVVSFYSDDPRGNIPSAVVNWAASTGVPKFFDKMEQACGKYDSWAKERDAQVCE